MLVKKSFTSYPKRHSRYFFTLTSFNTRQSDWMKKWYTASPFRRQYINYLIVCWRHCLATSRNWRCTYPLPAWLRPPNQLWTPTHSGGALLMQNIQVQLHVFGGRYVLRVWLPAPHQVRWVLMWKEELFF